jgi:CHC2 zinc finger
MAIATTRAFRRELLPAAIPFYEGELGRLGRPNHAGWCPCRCPFHNSKSGKSFAVHGDGAFICRGCAVRGGDLITFLRLRYKLSFIDACKSLGCWDSVSDADRHAIAPQSAEREKRAEEAKLKRLAHEQRIQLRNQVHTAARIQRETSDRLIQLLKGAVENYPQEQEHCWSTLALCLDDLRQTEAQYMSSMGMEYL